jgi:hypothetical protein
MVSSSVLNSFEDFRITSGSQIIVLKRLCLVELWKQQRCPTTNKWIKKMWYLDTMEFYSATKKNETLSFAGKWMELENIILSDVSRAQKAKTLIFSLISS